MLGAPRRVSQAGDGGHRVVRGCSGLTEFARDGAEDSGWAETARRLPKSASLVKPGPAPRLGMASTENKDFRGRKVNRGYPSHSRGAPVALGMKCSLCQDFLQWIPGRITPCCTSRLSTLSVHPSMAVWVVSMAWLLRVVLETSGRKRKQPGWSPASLGSWPSLRRAWAPCAALRHALAGRPALPSVTCLLSPTAQDAA